MVTDLAWVGIVLAVVIAAVAGWRWAVRYRPQHKRDAAAPRHVAVSAPRPLGSMCLDAELTIRGADDHVAQPGTELPWRIFGPPPEYVAIATAVVLDDAGSEWVDPMLSRLLRTTGEVLRGKLFAEIVAEMDRQDRDTAAYCSQLAEQAARIRLALLTDGA